MFLTNVRVRSPSMVLLSRPAGRLSVRKEGQLCSFVGGTTSALVIIDRSQALLGLLGAAYRLAPGGVAACKNGCRFCGRRGNVVLGTLRRRLRRGRGRLHLTQGVTHRIARQGRGRGMHNRGTDTEGNVPHVVVGALGSETRGDAAGLGSVRTRGTRGLANRVARVEDSLSSTTMLGASFSASKLHVKGVLVATASVGFNCGSRLL